ncbi:hypothetical protein MSG28_005027 [Choristoneura fumiferana]|uniref:Uncharacterized protein n=1 Tax=Choristoneura fumiferana TaxID=7141 RepID=A0ACC0JPL1_CHOFU|nr:hypothetical protein MSG28_005027 [Choristoneura fumiferana]
MHSHSERRPVSISVGQSGWRAGPPECAAPCRRALLSPRVTSSPKRAPAQVPTATDATGEYLLSKLYLMYLDRDKSVADYSDRRRVATAL